MIRLEPVWEYFFYIRGEICNAKIRGNCLQYIRETLCCKQGIIVGSASQSMLLVFDPEAVEDRLEIILYQKADVAQIPGHYAPLLHLLHPVGSSADDLPYSLGILLRVVERKLSVSKTGHAMQSAGRACPADCIRRAQDFAGFLCPDENVDLCSRVTERFF